MGFTLRVDEELRVVFVKAAGAVTARDLCLNWLELIENPLTSALRRTLVDLRDADISIDLQDLHLLIEQLVRPRIGDTIWTAALIVGNPSSREMAQNFQLLAQSFSRDRVFEDEERALEWLLRQPAGDGRR
jgi:hypothetical protein